VLHLLIGSDRDARARVRDGIVGAVGTRPVGFDPDDPDVLSRTLAQVRTVPLFGVASPPELDLGERADPELLRALAATGVVTLVALVKRPPVGLLAELGAAVQVHDCGALSPAQQRSRIRTAVRDAPARFEPDAARYLESLAEHDPDRADAVLAQLLLLGRPEVTYAQVVRLGGVGRAPLSPWELGDALLSGDPARLVELVGRADPVVAWASVGRMLAQLQLVLETPQGVETRPPLPGGVRSRLSGVLGRFERPGLVVVEALTVWVAADRLIKADPRPPEQLLAATARLAAVVAGHR
jgi:hypothetical protein